MPRFVVLRHEKDRAAHFDFMLEREGVLLTFSFADFPAAGAACERIADHRLAYLDFEGDIGEGKGVVARADGGTFDLLGESEDAVFVCVRGERLRGNVKLMRESGDTWRLKGE
jgi:hypothetical protein